MDRENRQTEQDQQDAAFDAGAAQQAPFEAESDDAAASAQGTSTDASQQDAGDVSTLLQRLDQVTAEVEEYRNRALRAQADFDNYRKRMTREREETRKFASAGLVESLLPVIDNMALGLNAARQHHPEAQSILEGFEMVLNQLKGVLREHGVEELNPVGKVFDPNFHESVANQPSDEIEEGYVIQVHRIGYALNGRLIRPAVVVISSGSAK